MSELHRSNGTGMPPDWQGVSDDVCQRLELAYQEIQRRDSQAEQRAWRKDRLVQRLGLVILVLAGVLVWLVLTQHQVKAFVQTVQVADDGTLVQLGVPQDLYAYRPPDGVYMEMVAQWVRWTRWRGEDERMTKVQWAWAYRHTCGIAQKWLKALEEKEKPFRVEQPAGGGGHQECDEDCRPGELSGAVGRTSDGEAGPDREIPALDRRLHGGPHHARRPWTTSSITARCLHHGL